MKCPNLKRYRTTRKNKDKGHYFSYASGLIEYFQECIKSECMAWNKEDETCNQFSNMFVKKRTKRGKS